MRAENYENWMNEMLDNCADPSEIWEGRVVRGVLRKEHAVWLNKFAIWQSFVTLTFRDDKSDESARKLFRLLIKALNSDLLGKNYQRYVGQSYFSYVLATEYQLRGNIHFHLLADKPLNFKLIHDCWREWAGFAFTDVIRNPERTCWYIAKYIAKNGDVDLWKSERDWIPVVLPKWWKAHSWPNDLINLPGMDDEAGLGPSPAD